MKTDFSVGVRFVCEHPPCAVYETWHDPGGGVNGAGSPRPSHRYVELQHGGEFTADLSDAGRAILEQAAEKTGAPVDVMLVALEVAWEVTPGGELTATVQTRRSGT